MCVDGGVCVCGRNIVEQGNAKARRPPLKGACGRAGKANARRPPLAAACAARRNWRGSCRPPHTHAHGGSDGHGRENLVDHTTADAGCARPQRERRGRETRAAHARHGGRARSVAARCAALRRGALRSAAARGRKADGAASRVTQGLISISRSARSQRRRPQPRSCPSGGSLRAACARA